MNKPEFKLNLSTPVDEYGTPIRLTFTPVNWFTLKVEQHPDFSVPLVGFALAVIFILLFLIFAISSPQNALGCAGWACLAAAIFAIQLYSMRVISCTFDKQFSKGRYFRSGPFGLQFDERAVAFNLADISRIEMQRHVNRRGDTFDICLLLQNGQKLSLSGGDLNFSQCQEYAEKIRDFIQLETPVKAVD